MKRYKSVWNNLVDLNINKNKIRKLNRYFATTDSIKLKKFVEIPGPKSFPLVGNLFSYKEFG
jgi:hypothetical protein